MTSKELIGLDSYINNIDKMIYIKDMETGAELYRIFKTVHCGYLPNIITSVYKMGFILGQRHERLKRR